ncbi:MAG: tetratricopeptide repeat protein [Trueperaceae bacterium]|nr:tetratricopeptide repeat protein [Trueperaceae bacterium]
MTTPMLHRTFRLPAVLATLLALVLATAFAQDTARDTASDGVTRVVVVPFQGPAELASWQIGLAAGLQRSLNRLGGVFVPPIGDPVVLADQAARAGLDPATVLRDRFGADALLGGRVASAPSGLDVTVERYGPAGIEASSTVTVPSVPSEAMPRVVTAAIEVLGLDVSAADQDAARRVAANAPSVEGLQAASLAASRLAVPDAAALRAAAELAPDSSWLMAEQARAASLVGDHELALERARAATDAEPDDVEAWTVLGVAAFRAGDRQAAEAAYRAALERNPAHAVARAGLAGLLGGDDALREYRRALDAYPRLLEAHVAIAQALGGARGLQTLRSAAEALPDSVELHAAVVEAALEAGDAAGALAYLRDTSAEPLARRPGLYALAAELPADREAEALAFLREGAEAFPDDAGLAIAEARLLREGGDAPAAEARLRPFYDDAPDDPRVANALALALVAQERTDEARSVLDGAADASATVRFNLAQALLEAGLPRAAAEELAPDATEAQDDADVWAVYGTALAGAGRFDEARDALERALTLDEEQPLALRTVRRLDERARIAGDADDVGAENDALPREARAAFDRGLTHLEQGRNAEAVTELRTAYDATSGDAPLIAFYLANALQRDGRPGDAIELYEIAREALPENGTILNNLGFAWLQTGRYDRALPTLRDAVRVAPDNARAHLNLGLTFYGLTRYQDALDAWERAVSLDPSLDAAIADTRERAERQVPDSAP